MNTRSASEYTMFAPAQLLCDWREQRPSNQGDVDSGVTGEVRRDYYAGGGSDSNSSFIMQYVIVVGLNFKWHILKINNKIRNCQVLLQRYRNAIPAEMRTHVPILKQC
jgi:hypothetical protein